MPIITLPPQILPLNSVIEILLFVILLFFVSTLVCMFFEFVLRVWCCVLVLHQFKDYYSWKHEADILDIVEDVPRSISIKLSHLIKMSDSVVPREKKMVPRYWYGSNHCYKATCTEEAKNNPPGYVQISVFTHFGWNNSLSHYKTNYFLWHVFWSLIFLA